ncbi:MAG TPA: hypothetical protein VFI73_09330 [Candidatus Nitrosopolaris sp.]|nr:hypothetical protein [Candidatus Nitrosopolaris sp.]
MNYSYEGVDMIAALRGWDHGMDWIMMIVATFGGYATEVNELWF